ncbi:SGNH/GDSL hydrolase family protein [Pseudonocardia oroxyli]|uniref:GDSL-like Lipase/Acylhydrolase family protein n=1 Tax=Pseudonocardia oroxyli TaxID=366584 RepID=A0A1G7ZD44_PSEOR|nr:hypothetical protein [Pseudonocardia oroxyli]SDH06604.1 GDSL-like Lipase/Acylhydrolase family protein [Pseudonocardia oroxyli]
MGAVDPLVVPSNPRIAVLGDSLAAGLGVREHSYPRMVAKDLQASAILMKAKASRPVEECTALLPRLDKFEPDLVLISTGQTESLVHPRAFVNRAVERFGPESWRGLVGLDARPFYSAEPDKRRSEMRSTAARIAVKNAAIHLTGGVPRVPHETYRAQFRAFLDETDRRGWPVVVASIGFPNAVFYPRSRRSLAVAERIQVEEAAGRPNVRIVHLNGLVDFRRDTLADRCHPSVLGHRKIADAHHAVLEVAPAAEMSQSIGS